MSEFTRLPKPTAWAITITAAIATLALATVDPVIAVAVVCGLLLSGILTRFDRSHRHIALAATLLPAFVLVTTVVVIQPATRAVVALAGLGLLLGTGVGGTLYGSPSSTARDRAAVAMVLAAVLTAIAAIITFAVDAVGHWRLALESLRWLGGDGLTGLFIALVVAALAGVAALVALPDAMITTARRRDAAKTRRYTLAQLFGVLLVATLVSLAAVTVVGWYLPTVGWLIGTLVASDLVRGFLALLTLGGGGLAAFGLVVRRFWNQPSESPETNGIVPITVGTAVGTLLSFVFVSALGARAGELESVGILFGVVTVVLVLASVVTWHAGAMGGSTLPRSPYVVVVALAAAGVGLGLLAESEASGTGVGAGAVGAGVPTFVVIAAALLCYDLGRYGRRLTREIGTAGAAPMPQLVRVGWSGVVATVGVVVATGGFWLATVFQPTLSVPATVGVVAGFGVLVAGARLLLR
ncbi:uncharacterized protein Nmag_2956 [Natrialba magadii ATCC 43099]|uniref:Uncharacterized protein n=1 Tax=Natrialba magadii (strain ATCC 43099 / DSM 3394 / CCM 3739 / CIP 104546 / IAM 13178 / JCM 8861 / NBRC 102185 / NCIMB 2190 / MS3) TaxID=547559 RepID=D3T0M9_NATMM|nr:hypothetical protein [Natrialba magadii]ADD06508.1 uncharacterized protein Nmag_2956 [Natrialba magadii ATCC 43099]ELY32030.1 hypothetical protein C500_05613 [Natrialba magadii ATCC 43099]